MALTANRELNRYVDQELRAFPVLQSTHIYKGALVGIERQTGYVRGLVSGDVFAGIAYEEANNGSGPSGAMSVRLYTQGDFVLPAANASRALTGMAVHATSDESTDVVPSQGGSLCGIMLASSGANSAIVRINPMAGPQVEHAVQVPLQSLTSSATTNSVMITQRAIRLVGIDVCFNTVPDQGNLDVGTHASDPDEMVDAFDLSTLSANTPSTMALASTIFGDGLRVWAKVGQASSTAGVGGVLSVRYIELP